MRAAIEFLISAIAFIQGTQPFASPVVSYECGSPELAAAVRAWANVSGVEDGGCSADPVISLRIIDPWPYTDRGGQAVRVGQRCTIELRPEYEHDATVMIHESGHCLGLGHSMQAGTRVVGDPGPSGAVMHWNPCNKTPGAPGPNVGPCNSMNADDIAGIRSLYGPFEPTPTPTATPTRTPSPTPVATPTPTATKTAAPSTTPTAQPTIAPTATPTAAPTQKPVTFRVVLPMVAR